MPIPVCDIVLLSWNKLEVLKPCVESLFQHTSLPVRLFIIDNGSDEETKTYLRSLTSSSLISLELIFNETNKGFVGGMNCGMRLSQAPYVCLLNNDTIMTPNWLELCLDAFEKNSQAGIVNPNSSTFGVWPNKNQNANDIAEVLKEKHQANPFTEAGCCVGFCMFIKREVIQKIGFLEESVDKIFFEDTDFCKRAKEAGYLCMVANQAYVFHHEHKTFPKKKDRDVFFKKNEKWFYEKWGKAKRIFFPKKTALTEEEKNLITQWARKDHFVYISLPEKEQGTWKNPHAHIRFLYYHYFPKLHFIWQILKRQKKPYDQIVIHEYPFLGKLWKKRSVRTPEVDIYIL